ncbi:MAG TPA: MFS transporter [Anaerolineaceae bacterium]|nr:MFS transporter [Anaerolineaceae bacterium]
MRAVYVQKQETAYLRTQTNLSAIVLITQTIALLIGGYIADGLGFEIILLISGIAGISQAVVFAFLKEPAIHALGEKGTTKLTDKLKESAQQIIEVYKSFMTKISVLFIAGFSVVFYISSGYLSTIQQPYLISIGFDSYSAISVILALINGFSALALLVYGKVVPRSRSQHIIYQALIFTIGIILLGLLPDKKMIINLLILNSILEIGSITLLETLNKEIPSSVRATLISTQNQINVVFNVVFGMCIGKAVDLVGINRSNFITGFFLLFATALLLFLKNKKRSDEKRQF